MLCGLPEIQMEMSLLEMGVQLMILPTTSFLTMNVTPYRCFKSSPQYQILCPLSVVVSSNCIHLTSARPRMSSWQCFNSWVSYCTFSLACREWTFHVPTVVPSFGSLMVVFTPVAHLSPPPWSLTVGCGPCWSRLWPIQPVVSLLCFLAMGKLGGTHLLSKSS